jgi:hypothetical protein
MAKGLPVSGTKSWYEKRTSSPKEAADRRQIGMVERRGWDLNPGDACTPSGFQDGLGSLLEPTDVQAVRGVLTRLRDRSCDCCCVEAA